MQAGFIKLNTNENPYEPSLAVIDDIKKYLEEKKLRLYPDPNATQLKQVISNYYDIDPSNVFVGNGSDEVLAHVFNGLLDRIEPILFPDITYSFYTVYCSLYKINYEQIPLNDDYQIVLSDYYRSNGGIIFANPNAPTGRYLTLSSIHDLLDVNRNTMVVIDEAYIDFGGESAIPLIKKYDNLLIVQTLSKSRSLAGLRIGFAIGHEDLIVGLERIKNSFNSYPLNHLSLIAACSAIEDRDHFEKTRNAIVESREWLSAQLQLRNFEVLPSCANFVFARHSTYSGEVLQKKLREKLILVRYFNKPRLDRFLRITIGTQRDCECLIQALDTILQDGL